MTELLVPFNTTGRRPALFCVHSASGSAYSYLPLVPVLADRYLQAIAAERPAELAGIITQALQPELATR